MKKCNCREKKVLKMPFIVSKIEEGLGRKVRDILKRMSQIRTVVNNGDTVFPTRNPWLDYRIMKHTVLEILQPLIDDMISAGVIKKDQVKGSPDLFDSLDNE